MGEELSAGKVSLKVEGNTKGFGSEVARGIEAEKGFLSNVGHRLKDTLLAGFGALGIGVAVGEYIKSGIEEYTNFDAMNAQFAAGIKSTGNSAHLTVEEMDKLAASVAGYSGQSEASIGKTEQVLQTFTDIKNVGPNKIFDEATVAAANMAAKLGGDASGSAIQLGKALQDPVKGMTALRRVGVSFTADQQAAIKADVARGNSLGAQKIILGELNREFGGAAKAAGETFPGQIARAKVAMGELNKAIVMAVLPVLTPLIGALADKIQSLVPRVEEAASVFRDRFLPALDKVRDVFNRVISLLEGNDLIKFKPIDLGPWTKPLILAGDIIRAVFGAIKGVVGKAFDSIGQGASPTNSALANLAMAFLKLIQQLSPLGLLLKGLGPTLPGIAKSLASVLNAAIPLVGVISDLVVQVLKLIAPLLKIPGVLGTVIALFIAWKLAMAGAKAYMAFEEFGKGLQTVSTKFKAFYALWFAKNAEQTAAEEKGAAKSVAVRVASFAKIAALKVKDLAQTVAIQAMYAKDAVVNAAKVTAAWVASTAKTAAAFVASAAKSTAAWVVANAKIIAGWVAQAGAAVANGARVAAVWLAQKAAVLAQVAVMGILKGAQLAATAAQWLFNAAMDANPIGLIIAAVVALVAALVWFFTQTKLGKVIWQDIVNFLVGAWNLLVSVATTVWNAIVAVVTTVINVVKGIINTVVAWITAYWTLEVNAWRTIITVVFNAIHTVVTTVINTVKGIINTVVGWISAFWSREVTGWRTIITVVWNAIHTAVSTAINTVKSVISAAVAFVTGVWNRTWSTVLSVLRTAWSNVINTVTTAVGKVVGFVRDLGNKIISTIGGFVGGMVTAAGNLIQGLIQGIQAGGAKVVTAIIGVAKGALDAVKNFFGIKSPSRVFHQIGLFLGQGLQNGINGTQKQVQSAALSLTDKVKSAFDTLVQQRTAAQKRLATLDREYGDVTGMKAAARKRREVLQSQINDEKSALRSITAASKAGTESTVLKLIKSDTKKLSAEAARRDSITAKLKADTAKAAAALKTQTDYAASVTSNALGQGSVIGVTGTTNKDGTTNAATSNDIIAKLKQAVADTKLFAADLTQLRKMGLDDVTFKQLVDAGVGGGGLDAAKELLNGGQSAVAQVASLQNQLQSSSEALGKSAASGLYGAATKSADGLVNGLKDSDKKVTSQMEKLGASMVKALKKKLAIHSPSRVAHELGTFFGDGLANGLTASTPKVTKSSVDLFKVPTTAAAKFPTVGGIGSAHAPIVNNFNGQMGYTADEVADSIVTRQRRAQQKVKVPRVVT